MSGAKRIVCFQSKAVSAPCSACGRYADPLHIDGVTFACADHCQPCNAPSKARTRTATPKGTNDPPPGPQTIFWNLSIEGRILAPETLL